VMSVEASVAEADIGSIARGAKVELSVPAFPGRTFEASVERLSLEPTRGSAVVTYPVTLRVDNPELIFRPGMSADVRILASEVRDVLAVREAALRFQPDGTGKGTRTRLWLSRDGINIESIDVTPGVSDGAYTQIESSGARTLAAGDAAIVGFLHPDQVRAAGPGITLGAR
jgi:HlyD family secretion protein